MPNDVLLFIRWMTNNRSKPTGQGLYSQSRSLRNSIIIIDQIKQYWYIYKLFPIQIQYVYILIQAILIVKVAQFFWKLFFVKDVILRVLSDLFIVSFGVGMYKYRATSTCIFVHLMS